MSIVQEKEFLDHKYLSELRGSPACLRFMEGTIFKLKTGYIQ